MNLICMAPDGDYVTEREGFKTPAEAWERSGDMGSRWIFYPYHFVTNNSGKSILEAPDELKHLEGKRIKTVARIFKKWSAQNV